MPTPPPIELDPPGPPRSSVIWLHGLGADGNDFLPIVSALRLPDELMVRFVFPNAPAMPVTVNGGYLMPAWYDIHGGAIDAQADLGGMVRSADYLQTLVETEQTRGVPAERIVLAGFSQGGVIALAAALRSSEPLAGVMALSTYLPEALMPQQMVARSIFQAHGLVDNVVPLQLGLAARDLLVDRGHRVEWHQYEMDHSVCPEEVTDIRAWLLDRLGA